MKLLVTFSLAPDDSKAEIIKQVKAHLQKDADTSLLTSENLANLKFEGTGPYSAIISLRSSASSDGANMGPWKIKNVDPA